MDIYTLTTILISCSITILLGKFIIPILTKFKMGQTILKIGPFWHEKKQGTPTMGGIMFIFGIIFSLIICIPMYYTTNASLGFQIIETSLMIIKLISTIFMAIGFGLIGFIDDFIKIKNRENLGLNAKQKLIMQFMVAASFLGTNYVAETFYSGMARTYFSIPFFGNINLGPFYWIFAAFAIVGIVNAVNLTDGIDGLCGSISLICSFGFIFVSKMMNMHGMNLISASMFGGCLGFLFWNFYPAKIFMGDTGSLFLGGLISGLGFLTGSISLITIFSATYILEILSVIFQVIYFKISKGKRFFKMSPIHHHFEMIGFSERKICIIFSLITMFFISLGILLFALGLY